MLSFIPLVMMLDFFHQLPCQNEICYYSSELHCIKIIALVDGQLVLCHILELKYGGKFTNKLMIMWCQFVYIPKHFCMSTN